MKYLVTGLGTVGTEFVNQLLEEGHTVTAIDANEWVVASCRSHHNLTVYLADCSRFDGSFDYVIHTAAYKHIEILENNKSTCWENNVATTKDLMRNVKGSFVFISTDKAVEPTSFYGYSKEIGEELTKDHGGVIVRMGNIMASSGSVIPKWEHCIKEGLPLPITDERMTRYITPVTDAVRNSLALLKTANPGDVVIPAMGEPVALLDIAEEVLQKHGLTLHNDSPYPIYTIGMRAGEKLHEKLTWDNEHTIYQSTNGIIVRR